MSKAKVRTRPDGVKNHLLKMQCTFPANNNNNNYDNVYGAVIMT